MIARREVIAGIGAAAAWPLAAWAQPKLPVIGYLSSRTSESDAALLSSFKAGLGTLGYVENRNVAIEYLFADGAYDREAEMVADMVRRRPAVIAAAGTMTLSLAAKAATATIPIVANVGSDPVRPGLVASLSHPGGNVTGVYSQASILVSKNMGLLHELIPQIKTVAVLENLPNSGPQDQAAREAAAALHWGFRSLNATTEDQIDVAFATLRQQPADAILVVLDPFFLTRATQITELAARSRIPAIFPRRPFAEAGGLISYSDDVANTYNQFGIYTARVLNGEKPADLPILQTSRFELVINLKAARSLGLTIPPTLLATADEVIE